MNQSQSALIIAAVILSSAASAGHHEDSKSDAAPMMGSLSTAQKIDLAKASAPANVSDEARILDADNTVLQEGDNGWTCMVGTPPNYENPMCVDAVWLDWLDAMMSKNPIKTMPSQLVFPTCWLAIYRLITMNHLTPTRAKILGCKKGRT